MVQAKKLLSYFPIITSKIYNHQGPLTHIDGKNKIILRIKMKIACTQIRMNCDDGYGK